MRPNTWLPAGLLVACALTSPMAWTQTPVTVTYSYSGLPLPILVDSADVISVATILVPQALKTTTVTARVRIEYPNSGDLNVFLFSPEGTRSRLLERNCSVQNVDTTFADSAQSAWRDFCPVEAGRGPFRPNEPMSNFNSDDSAFGNWRLAVENNGSDSRTGWLREFSLTITGTPQISPIFRPDTILNKASLEGAGVVAPGEMISIFGIGVGPVNAVSAGIGALPSTLGGASVTFNGSPAPIAYASFYRLDVQAPFTLTPGTQATVVVNSGSSASQQLTVNVVDSEPGVYTNGLGGAGVATAVNQNGSTNNRLAPAPIGSFITVYASGLGALSPALNAGAVPPVSPLSYTTSPVTAAIGGIPAPVQYAGAAPGYPGLYQLNIQVPANVASGSQELVIYINGKSSQSGVTVSIQ